MIGVISAILGVLIVLPRVAYRTWKTQLVLNEMPWLAGILGIVAILRGRGRVWGWLGLGMSLVPYTRLRWAQKNMDAMMVDALGDDYESYIPDVAKKRMTQTRWSLKNTLGAAYYRNYPVRIMRDVVYVQRPTRPLKLDIFMPQVPPVIGDRYPAIIVLHGGGWYRGDKTEHFERHNLHLAAQGYVVFDAQYRFFSVDAAPWDAPLQDVREVIRWVKANADEYQVDTTKIALYGRSAGGQLALRAAYGACGEFIDTSVQAVVTAYAPTDLRLTGYEPDFRVCGLLGGQSWEVPETYADASPIEFVRDDLPPTLMMHGGADSLASYVHAELMLNKLRQTNTPCVVLRVPWGRHGFDAVLPGTGYQLTQYYVDRFLAWCMYHGQTDNPT
ncbi:MAG: hypothetical protein CUN56_06465 [Phototrophicales bacterium]|nr:MAG: hypothetical protein CUN56_06465 [Phototrophicales bacterium]RMG75519.1 MAG: alpha/beta hydrolase [Chloroflexota bacterium]